MNLTEAQKAKLVQALREYMREVNDIVNVDMQDKLIGDKAIQYRLDYRRLLECGQLDAVVEYVLSDGATVERNFVDRPDDALLPL